MFRSLTKTRVWVVAGIVSVGLLLALPDVTAAGEKKAEGTEWGAMSDTWAEASLVTTYTLNEHLNPFELDVEVSKGTARISGTVDNEVERDLAIELARGVDGIEEVESHIQVDPEKAEKTKERGFLGYVGDATTTARVKGRLAWNANTSASQINVDTKNAEVTLTGTVASDEEKDLAAQIARTTNGVRSVDNQLEVGETKGMMGQAAEKARAAGEKVADAADEASEAVADTAKSAGEQTQDATRSAGEMLSDAWVTTKVKSSMVYSSEVDALDINVDTSDGVVTLKGTVDSENEKRRAESIARDIVGVKRVENELGVAHKGG